MRASATYTTAFTLLAIMLVGCSSAATTDVPISTPLPQAESTDTDVPSATTVPPTETQSPPTETPVPAEPIEISEDQLADDGCPLVTLNTESWGPLYAAYTAGSDPLYQFHDNVQGFHFNVELYTVYGAGWTGQTGTFEPDCNSNGICIYLVPDDINSYWATAGEVTISSLAQEDGVLQEPVEIRMSNLTLEPVPGSSSTGCYHVKEVSIEIGE